MAQAAVSDIDVLVVSDGLMLETAFELLAQAEQALGRKVNPTVLTCAEFRRAMRGPFWPKVFRGRWVALIGSANEFESRLNFEY